MNIKKMLEYQSAQKEQAQLVTDYNNSDIMVKYNNAKTQRKACKNAIENYRSEIEKMSEAINNLNNKHKEIEKEIADVAMEKFDDLEDSQLNFYMKNLEKYQKELDEISFNANRLVNTLQSANSNMQKQSANLLILNDIYEKAKAISRKNDDEVIMPKLNAIVEKMKAIDLDKEDLELYESAKATFDQSKTAIQNAVVLVVLRDKSCGNCGIELSPQDYQKVMEQGYVKCPNCGHIVYKQ